MEEILQAWEGCSFKVVYIQINKHTSTSEWRMSREMECLCSIVGLKSEKEECSDSDFFSRKGCLLPQDGDKSWCKDHSLERNGCKAVSFKESPSYLGFKLVSYHGYNISIAEKDEKSSRGTESIAKISTVETVLLPVTQLQDCIQKACVEQRQPIHLTDILFLLAKADLTGRCFSASPGKKKSLVDRYGQMT